MSSETICVPWPAGRTDVRSEVARFDGWLRDVNLLVGSRSKHEGRATVMCAQSGRGLDVVTVRSIRGRLWRPSGSGSPQCHYPPFVFVESITLPRAEWESWQERLRYTIDPPGALVATVAWDAGDGQVIGVNVWDTPEAIADFFMERVRPILEAHGEPTNKPQRHGEPLAFYLRP